MGEWTDTVIFKSPGKMRTQMMNWQQVRISAIPNSIIIIIF